MRLFTSIGFNVLLVGSDPGDGTQYRYLVYRDGPDAFTFAPTNSTLAFPSRINKHAVSGVEVKMNKRTETLVADPGAGGTDCPIAKIAKETNSNSFVVAECIGLMRELDQSHPYNEDGKYLGL